MPLENASGHYRRKIEACDDRVCMLQAVEYATADALSDLKATSYKSFVAQISYIVGRPKCSSWPPMRRSETSL